MSEKLLLMDSTLRDGLQTPEITAARKSLIEIGEKLVRLGIPIIEAGQPMGDPLGVHEDDISLIDDAKVVRALVEKLKASTKSEKPVITALSDLNENHIDSAISCGVDTVSIWGNLRKGKSLGRRVDASVNMVQYANEKGVDVYFYMTYATQSEIKELINFCNRVSEFNPKIIYCDTVGTAHPTQIKKDISALLKSGAVEEKDLFIHAHNDLGRALLNTLAAVDAGARGISGTFLGMGDRCGNAALEQVIDYYMTTNEFDLGFDIDHNAIREICGLIALNIGFNIPKNQPIVGDYASMQGTGKHKGEGWQAKGALPPNYTIGRNTGRYILVKILEYYNYKNPDKPITPTNLALRKTISLIKKAAGLPNSKIRAKNAYMAYFNSNIQVAKELRANFAEFFEKDVSRIGESIPEGKYSEIYDMNNSELTSYVEKGIKKSERDLAMLKLAYLLLIKRTLFTKGEPLRKKNLSQPNKKLLAQIGEWLSSLYFVQRAYVLEQEGVEDISELEESVRGPKKEETEIRRRNQRYRIDVFEFYKENPRELISAVLMKKNRVAIERILCKPLTNLK